MSLEEEAWEELLYCIDLRRCTPIIGAGASDIQNGDGKPFASSYLIKNSVIFLGMQLRKKESSTLEQVKSILGEVNTIEKNSLYNINIQELKAGNLQISKDRLIQKYADALYYQGLILYHQAKYKEAIESFDEALKINQEARKARYHEARKARYHALGLEADNLCKNNDIQSLVEASKKVCELEKLDCKNNALPKLIENINNSAYGYMNPLTDWLTNNSYILRLEVERIRKGLYDDFYNLVDFLSYTGLQKIKDAPLLYLVTLWREVDRQTLYKPEDKRSIEALLRRIKSISHLEIGK